MYDRLLMPTDGNARTRTVADQAIGIADAYDAKLYVLHVLDLDRFPGTVDSDLHEVLREDGQSAIDHLLTLADDADIDAEGMLKGGRPAPVILEVVETIGIDLVVMGTHGRSGVERMLLGSVTEQVIRESPCPVLTVDLSAPTEQITSKSAAIDAAREAVNSAGESVEELTAEPYREYGTWIVPLETVDGVRYNVHIAAETGQTRLARVHQQPSDN